MTTNEQSALLTATLQSLNTLKEVKELLVELQASKGSESSTNSEQLTVELQNLQQSTISLAGELAATKTEMKQVTDNMTVLLEAVASILENQIEQKNQLTNLKENSTPTNLNQLTTALVTTHKNLKAVTSYVDNQTKKLDKLSAMVEDLSSTYIDTNARLKRLEMSDPATLQASGGLDQSINELSRLIQENP